MKNFKWPVLLLLLVFTMSIFQPVQAQVDPGTDCNLKEQILDNPGIVQCVKDARDLFGGKLKASISNMGFCSDGTTQAMVTIFIRTSPTGPDILVAEVNFCGCSITSWTCYI